MLVRLCFRELHRPFRAGNSCDERATICCVHPVTTKRYEYDTVTSMRERWSNKQVTVPFCNGSGRSWALWLITGIVCPIFEPLMATLGPRWASSRSLMPAFDRFVVDAEIACGSLLSMWAQAIGKACDSTVGSSLWQSLRLHLVHQGSFEKRCWSACCSVSWASHDIVQHHGGR